MNNKKNIKNIPYLLILITISGLFLLFFSCYTSPLYPDCYGYDASFFMMAGRAITKGAIPYLDFFDQKGPFLFFIQAFGMSLYDERFGPFIVQFIFLCVSCILMFYIARYFCKPFASVILIIFVLVIFSVTCEGGNLTEEYSLPFVLCPILLSINGIRTKNYKLWYSFIYGICFTLLILIRFINAAIIGGIILFFAIDLVCSSNYRALLKHVIAFIIGSLLAFLPFAIYFLSHNAFYDMIYGTFIFPLGYAKNGIDTRTFDEWAKVIGYLSPALFCIAASFLYMKKDKKIALFAISISIISFFAFIPGFAYLHYYTMILPLLMIALLFIVSLIKSNVLLLKKYIIRFLFCVIAFAFFLFTYLPLVKQKGTATLSLYSHPEVNKDFFQTLRKQANIIPDSEKDSVWGYAVAARWFTASNITPYFKYNAFQDAFMVLDPSILRSMNEMLDTAPPSWIVIDTNYIDTYPYLKNILKTKYEAVSQEENFILYQKL